MTKKNQQTEENKSENNDQNMVLTKYNYKLMIIGLVIIVIGFILMSGGGSKDPNIFSYEIFSFRRITIAPIVVMGGFIFEIYAIMHKPKKRD